MQTSKLISWSYSVAQKVFYFPTKVTFGCFLATASHNIIFFALMCLWLNPKHYLLTAFGNLKDWHFHLHNNWLVLPQCHETHTQKKKQPFFMCNGKEHKQKPEIHTLNGRKTEECVNRGKIILRQRETRAI